METKPVKLFGTDGIRGEANTPPLTPDLLVRIGQAIAAVLVKSADIKKVVIGRDTRLSADMLESALMAGICSMGVDVVRAGIVPTPAVAYMTVAHKAAAGIVISASHNPFKDNGIKIFSHKGVKLSIAQETELEALCAREAILPDAFGNHQLGRIDMMEDADKQYVQFLKLGAGRNMDLAGLRIILDCANGATFKVAPALYTLLGANCVVLNTSPNGININDGCGSEYPQKLAQKVLQHNAHLGLAFDGDGDRLIVVDEKGQVLTGDQLIAICALFYKQAGRLVNNAVVTTVMSNLGLKLFLEKNGVNHYAVDVGDRHVIEKMFAVQSVCGGENSGHYIFLDYHTTGDGLLSSLCLIQAIQHYNKPLSVLAEWMTVLPQQLVNINVTHKPPLDKIDGLAELTDKIEQEMAGKGRVLIRYSGTQSVCRVMVEGVDDAQVNSYSHQLAEFIGRAIGVRKNGAWN